MGASMSRCKTRPIVPLLSDLLERDYFALNVRIRDEQTR